MRETSERRTWKKAAGFVVLGGLGVFGLSLVFPGVRDQITTQVLGASAKKPDTTPPVSISFPATGGVYGPATWTGSVRGSASDGTGVTRVEVQFAGGAWVLASGTTSWSSPLSLPAGEGLYTVSVRATDNATPAANTSSPVTVTFSVDRTAPPTPTLSQKPENPSFDTKPHFAYSDTEAGVTFQCQLDINAAQACGSSVDYSKLSFGDHTFSVVALDSGGNRSPAATYGWTFLENKAFGITGALTPPLYPGASIPLDLTLSNPYNFTIRVTGIGVSATKATTTNGTLNNACLADVRTSGLTTQPVDIPANSSRPLSFYFSLAQWPEGWPRVGMVDTNVSQDTCKDTTFTLSYTGTAQKS